MTEKVKLSNIDFDRILNLKLLGKILGLFLLVYLLSFVGYLFPFLNHVIFVGIILATVYLSWKRLDYGVFIILAELIMGVKGYLFSFNIMGFVLSLRIALFLVVAIIWFVKRRNEKFKFISTKYFLLYALFVVALGVGVITALMGGNSLTNIFFDINGYLFLGLAFIFFAGIKKESLNKFISIIIAGSLAVAIITILISGFFFIWNLGARPDMADIVSTELSIDDEDEPGSKLSHSTTAKSELLEYGFVREYIEFDYSVYRWVTDTSIGQVAYLAGPFFRFFTDSQIYCLLGLMILLAVILKKDLNRSNRIRYLFLAGLNLSGILLGFSRSIWLGLIVACVVLLIALPWRKSLKIAMCGAGIVMIMIILTGTLLPSFYDVMSMRISSIVNPSEEEAGTNRFNQLGPVTEKINEHLIIGSGFGTTVEYDSVAPEKFGKLRVFAFEWAYLDTILEVGILGLFIYLLFIHKIIKTGLDKYKSLNNTGRAAVLGILATVVGLLIINITTPYLNHPLGIGILIIAMLIFFLI